MKTQSAPQSKNPSPTRKSSKVSSFERLKEVSKTSPSPRQMGTHHSERSATLRSNTQGKPSQSSQAGKHSKEWEENLRKATEISRKAIEKAVFESKEEEEEVTLGRKLKQVRDEERKRFRIKYVCMKKKEQTEQSNPVAAANATQTGNSSTRKQEFAVASKVQTEKKVPAIEAQTEENAPAFGTQV